jgi:hypothetical protein
MMKQILKYPKSLGGDGVSFGKFRTHGALLSLGAQPHT